MTHRAHIPSKQKPFKEKQSECQLSTMSIRPESTGALS